MDIASLQRQYAACERTPEEVIEAAYDEIERKGLRPVWISLIPREDAARRCRELAAKDPATLPLYGVPFAAKDNIDVAGVETTAGCPAFAHTPETSALVIQRLEQAGAILLGKTNMDQFATGLVGTRSPFGACASVFSDRHIAGGSSSGSAVAVASGVVSFALGTDTAGSGRVPAAFNNLIGLKPTRGVVSTRGVLPACRTLDCVSIFAGTAGDAARVLEVLERFDTEDPFSRERPVGGGAAPWSASLQASATPRVGVLPVAQRDFGGDQENARLYQAAVDFLRISGAPVEEVDMSPFFAAARLLYQGPWVAERRAAIDDFYQAHADEMDPVVAGIVGGAARYSAVQAFEAEYQLQTLRRQVQGSWKAVDVLLLPTAPRQFTLAEIAASPVENNSRLGTYTNFVNLLDMAAVAVPAGMRADGLPFGVTVMGPAFTERALLPLADDLHRGLNVHLGGSQHALEGTPALKRPEVPHGCQLMTVVGAHLSGQPLNWQLTQRGGRLLRRCRTHPNYRLYALRDTVPPKPGLVWSPGFEGRGIEVEVWALPAETVGSFVEGVPPPLGIGTVRLEDGTLAKGFIAETAALEGATEITHFGGWRAYLQSRT